MRYLLGLMTFLAPAISATAQDVSSGPEKEAKAAALKVFDATGAHKDKEIDYVAERKQAPTIYLFIHAGQFDRPMNRFMKTLDGLIKKDFEETYVVAVWLTNDADATKQLLPRVQQSVQYEVTALTLFDGPKEGPKGWYINADARLTAIVVNKSRVVATFGFQSINETNVPQVRRALAKAIKGKDKPATPAEQYKMLRREYGRTTEADATDEEMSMDVSPDRCHAAPRQPQLQELPAACEPAAKIALAPAGQSGQFLIQHHPDFSPCKGSRGATL